MRMIHQVSSILRVAAAMFMLVTIVRGVVWAIAASGRWLIIFKLGIGKESDRIIR